MYYGAQKQDLYGYWDTTEAFLDKVNGVAMLNRKNSIQIKAPFVGKSKTDVLQTGLALDVDFSKTWTCYSAGPKASRKTSTSAERLRAFANLGMVDPLEYED